MNVTILDLHEGINEFNCEVSPQNYDIAEAGSFPGPLRLKIFVDKLNDLFRFKISINADVEIPCDRCLEPFLSKIDVMIEQIYHLGADDLGSDEIIVLPENSKEINITDIIQEAIVLNRQIKQVCQDECKGLCSNCGINLNEKECDCHLGNVDPRLEKLKSLLK
jgi:uncharacterized protein